MQTIKFAKTRIVRHRPYMEGPTTYTMSKPYVPGNRHVVRSGAHLVGGK